LENSVTRKVWRATVNGRKGAWEPTMNGYFGKRVEWEGPYDAHHSCAVSGLWPL